MLTSTQETITLKSGSHIFIEGDDKVDSVYIIRSGKVLMKNKNSAFRSSESVLRPGDIIGLISCLTGRPRMSSAIVVEDAVLVRMTRQGFQQQIESRYNIAIKILDLYAKELFQYNAMFFQGSDAFKENYDERLLWIGRYYIKQKNYPGALQVLTQCLEHYPESAFRPDIEKLLEKLNKHGVTQWPKPTKKGLSLEFRNKSIIFSENEPGNELFLLKKGMVKIVKYNKDEEILLTILKPGDLFGELTIISNKPRSASAIAFGAVSVMPITRSTLKLLINRSPKLIHAIFTTISERLWFSINRLESRLYNKPITRIYVFIRNKLIVEKVSLNSREPASINFGLEELLSMNSTSKNELGSRLDDLLGDPIVTISHDTIEIKDPARFNEKVSFLISRDDVTDFYEMQDKSQQLEQARSKALEKAKVKQENAEVFHLQEASKKKSDDSMNDLIKRLVEKLKSSDPATVVKAAEGLGRYKTRSHNAVPDLQLLITSENAKIRNGATKALIQIMNSEQFFEYIVTLSQEEKSEKRAASAAALGYMQPYEPEKSQKILLHLIHDTNPSVRFYSVRSIILTGKLSDEHFNLLLNMIYDPEPSVRLALVKSISSKLHSGQRMSLMGRIFEQQLKKEKNKKVQEALQEALKNV